MTYEYWLIRFPDGRYEAQPLSGQDLSDRLHAHRHDSLHHARAYRDVMWNEAFYRNIGRGKIVHVRGRVNKTVYVRRLKP